MMSDTETLFSSEIERYYYNYLKKKLDGKLKDESMCEGDTEYLLKLKDRLKFYDSLIEGSEIFRTIGASNIRMEDIDEHVVKLILEEEKNDGSWFSCHQVSDEEEKND